MYMFIIDREYETVYKNYSSCKDVTGDLESTYLLAIYVKLIRSVNSILCSPMSITKLLNTVLYTRPGLHSNIM